MMYLYKKIFIVFLLTPIFIFSLNINVKSYGAKGNGIIDDTQAFQKAVDDLKKNGGGTLEVPKGNYPVTFLKFFGKGYSNISIVGNNANIIQLIKGQRKSVLNNQFKTFAERYAADGCFIFDAQVSSQKDDSQSIKNIKISGLNFISDVEKHGFDELLHQISAHGVSNFIVENCTFTGFLGDGIAISGGSDFSQFSSAYNKNVTIRNCKFDGINKNNRQGISIYYSDGFVIDRCSFKNITRDDMPGAIDIEPDKESNVSRNGLISNCTFENIGGNAAVVIHTRIPSQENKFSHQNFIIKNCTFNKVKQALSVVGNESFRELTDLKNFTTILQDCIIQNARGIAHIRHGYNVLFKNNVFENINNKDVDSIIVGGASNLTFENCRFTNVSNPNGIAFYGETHYINFIGCTFRKFNKNAITINDNGGIGNIVNNVFSSSDSRSSLPLVTPQYKDRKKVGKAVLKNNKSGTNFQPINLQYFYKK